jgi:hypothetical protein
LGEIDFLVQDDDIGIIPVEVKAGENVKAGSFNKYIDRYSPAAAVRYSKLPYGQTGRYTNIPLYLAGRTKDFL